MSKAKKLTIEKESLQDALKIASKIMAKGDKNLPILHNVLITNNSLTVTNLNEALVSEIETYDSDPDISICINGDFLVKAVKELAGGIIDFKIDKNRCDIGNLYKNIPLADSDEFPDVIPKVTKWEEVTTIKSIDLKKVLLVRPPTNEYQLGVQNALFKDDKIIATDSHRLHVLTQPILTPALIPLTALNVATSVTENFTVEADSGDGEPKFVRFVFGNHILYSRTMGGVGAFPNVNTILEQDNHIFFPIDYSNLIQSIHQSIPITFNSDTQAVQTKIVENKFHLSAISTEEGSEFETVLAVGDQPLEFDEKDAIFALNSRYFLDSLSCCDKICEMGLKKEAMKDNIVFLRSGDFLAGIMPTKI